jgi:hypothetical protein
MFTAERHAQESDNLGDDDYYLFSEAERKFHIRHKHNSFESHEA